MEQIINHIIMKDGQARIAGKAYLKAEMVARMYVGTDYSIEDVMAQYELSAAEVHATIAYYYDNQATLDANHKKVIDEIHQNAMSLGKLKAKIASRNKDNEN